MVEFILALVQLTSVNTWVGSWYSSPTRSTASSGEDSNPCTSTSQSGNFTQRVSAHLTIGGDRLRIHVSNRFGSSDLKVGAARVSTRVASAELLFHGQQNVLIPPGTSLTSDPADLSTDKNADISVTIFYPETIPTPATVHRNYHPEETPDVGVSHGNHVQDTTQDIPPRISHFTCFLTGIDVQSRGALGSIIAFGDSITDGGGRHWPALLAERLSKHQRSYGILNAGLVGNRIMRGGGIAGEPLLTRFKDEIFSIPDVKYVIVYEGINDIGLAATASDQTAPPKVTDITNAMRHLSQIAHSLGIKIFFATLTPFKGVDYDGYYTQGKELERQKVNQWVRQSRDIDGYFDFDKAVSDPRRPDTLKREVNLDNQHLNDAGEKAISDIISIRLFDSSKP